MSKRLVKVYSPTGEEETHPNLNAADLVRSCGYTYTPGRAFSPVDPVPFLPKVDTKAPVAQKILDGVGYDPNRPVVAEVEDDEVLNVGSDVEVAPVVLNTAAEEVAPAAPRRGRPPKSA